MCWRLLSDVQKEEIRAEWMEFCFNPKNEIIFLFPRTTYNTFWKDITSLMTP
jgi:hypothetical protein